MSGEGINIHASAVVVGTCGLLIVGRSSSGKSTLALALVDAAVKAGEFGALVSDDRVDITFAGGRIVARAPATIRGLAEIRGAGIVRVETCPAAVLHLAIRPVDPSQEARLPPEEERFAIVADRTLPLVRLPHAARDPLAVLRRLLPGPARS
ncbi:HPr kinase/phosphorylase [Ensifer soli]|uniref:HPr kinase/phosphorylase n=1 Tax=Ciceribacter sp. sgz301302 TaxID=3342379 RepID=UPI0035B8E66A